MFNLLKGLVGITETKYAAKKSAAKELKLTVDNCSFNEGEDASGKKWIRAYSNKKGFSSKYYYS